MDCDDDLHISDEIFFKHEKNKLNESNVNRESGAIVLDADCRMTFLPNWRKNISEEPSPGDIILNATCAHNVCFLLGKSIFIYLFSSKQTLVQRGTGYICAT
ncbi:unnamed protein product [Schistosoma curassoni]|uniref:DUF4806 domain-containing protein n=1 Tax=Schistosoma curassoni TaxID=6186 RepID=A0A183L1M9_9TREM|nr:unnamed protein product [Schistosoma curassoni]